MRYAMMMAASLLFLAPAAARADTYVVVRPCEPRVVIVERHRHHHHPVVIVEPCRPVRVVRHCR
jgi:hypothetical protein